MAKNKSNRRQKAKAVAKMSVKDRRAGAKDAGVSLKDFKQGRTGASAVARKTVQVNKRNPQPSSGTNNPSSSGGTNNPSSSGGTNNPSSSGGNTFTNAQMAGKGSGGGLVAARRKAQQNSGLSMSDYRAGVQGGTIDKHGRPKTGGGSTPNASPASNTFTTAAGYEMEKGAYRKGTEDIYNKLDKDSNGTAGTLQNSFITNFNKDGYLNYDSTKAQFQNNTALKEAGYKVGDMLWKPGTLDDLNGRRLTGRIGSIGASGIYHPEYEHDAINSSHQSTGNAGYKGQVGLGADQAAYNRQYEVDNDVEYGQVNQQLQNNGYGAQGASNFDGQQSFNNYGSQESDFQAPTQAANNFEMPNVQQSMGPQYQGWQEQMGNATQSPYAKNKYSKMNFDFNPYKFQQGQ